MKYVSRYLDVPNDALFPFGHGLSYATFAYSGVTLSAQSLSAASLTRDKGAQPLVATATVTNTGKRRATEVVQCYVRVEGTSTEQAHAQSEGLLCASRLKPGQSQTIRFPLGFAELSFYNAQAQQVVEPAQYTVYVGGSSEASASAQVTTVQ